jgi:cell division protein ZapD
MQNFIIYEQPLNERIRSFLRLEHLFAETAYFQKNATLWDSHACVSTFIEILMTLERTDIRSEILKELDRHMASLLRLVDFTGVDQFQLKNTLNLLSNQTQKMQLLPSKWGSEIRDNELLNSVRQRVAISGGTCSFDIPAYHYWLHQSAAVRANALNRWLAEVDLMRESIQLLLKMTRESGLFEESLTTDGLFQKTFTSQNPCQLFRIALPIDTPVYPEISGNKHRVNIRFLGYSELSKAKPISETLTFRISCCAI